MLKADVWRDHLMKEQASLDTRLNALEIEGDDKRFEDAREELSARLAEVHQRLSDMDAESGPARAAALLAGKFYLQFCKNIKSHACMKALVLMKLINRGLLGHSVEVGGKL